MGKGRKWEVEDVTGSHSHDPACKRLRTDGRLVVNLEAMPPLGSILSDQAALFRETTAHSTWRGAIKKVRLKKARLVIATQLVSRSQQAPYCAADQE